MKGYCALWGPRCKYFVILCPALTHADLHQELGQETWAERGWCSNSTCLRAK